MNIECKKEMKKKWIYFMMVLNLFLAFLTNFVFEVVRTAPKGAPIIAIIKGNVMRASLPKPSIGCSPGIGPAPV
jgi:hypothetical protein